MMQRTIIGCEQYVRRFNAYRICEHWSLLALFVTLASTGLAQKFYYVSISQTFIMTLGGITTVRAIHHFSGVLLALLLVEHVVAACWGMAFRHWQPSMLVTFKDFRDTQQNVSYYLGLTDSAPKFGRFNYKEKFVYWLILLGSFQLIASGFILWFPVTAAKVFAGQFIPGSKVVHSNDAMIIFLLIAIWHIYDSIFSPDVIPLDKSIFSGYISVKRMRHEHPLELDAADRDGDA